MKRDTPERCNSVSILYKSHRCMRISHAVYFFLLRHDPDAPQRVGEKRGDDGENPEKLES